MSRSRLCSESPRASRSGHRSPGCARLRLSAGDPGAWAVPATPPHYGGFTSPLRTSLCLHLSQRPSISWADLSSCVFWFGLHSVDNVQKRGRSLHGPRLKQALSYCLCTSLENICLKRLGRSVDPGSRARMPGSRQRRLRQQPLFHVVKAGGMEAIENNYLSSFSFHV